MPRRHRCPGENVPGISKPHPRQCHPLPSPTLSGRGKVDCQVGSILLPCRRTLTLFEGDTLLGKESGSRVCSPRCEEGQQGARAALQLQPATAAVSGDRDLGAGPGTQRSVGEVGWGRVCGSLTHVQAARVTSRMLVPVSSQEGWHNSLAAFVDSLLLPGSQLPR